MAKSLYVSILPQPEPSSVEEDAQTSATAADARTAGRSLVPPRMAELGLVDYVLDVAPDGDIGESFIVELNGLLNSGLFASNPQLVTEGLVR